MNKTNKRKKSQVKMTIVEKIAQHESMENTNQIRPDDIMTRSQE